MYLKQTKHRDGKVYLSIVHGYRDGKRMRTKTVRSLGSLEKLKAEFDDPIAHFRAECERMNAEAAEAAAPIELSFAPGEKVSKKDPSGISIGACAVLRYMERLGIHAFFDNRRRRTGFSYDPCRVLEMLVCNRVIDPASKKSAWEARGSFPRRCDFSLDDVYRSLDYLDKVSGKLVGWVNGAIEGQWGKRDISNVYYDVTNYYFECDDDGEGGLRRRGVSKEHRPNPIVQMGLMIDSEGIPMAYDVFPGNTNDCLTMLPVMKKVKAERGVGRMVVVADKGLNTSDDIAACVAAGDGYVFSQSVRKADASLKSWVLDPTGYDVRDGFKIKSKLADKTITLRDRDGRVIDTVEVPVRLVAFWSERYARRAAREREAVVAKAERLVRHRASYEHARSRGAGRYVRERVVDAGTGELQRSVVELDGAAIAADAELDGYYCLVTSEEGMAAEEVVDIYRGLWRIEESFKVMKSDFDARPVYVSTEAHIRAHFLVCYLALVVMRLMQRDTGWRHSAAKLSEAMRGLVVHHMKENWYLLPYRTDVTDDLEVATGLDFSTKVRSKRAIADMASKKPAKNRPKS